MECAGRSHAIGNPLAAAAAAVGIARPPIAISARATVVAIDESNSIREAIADERCGRLDANAGEPALTGGYAHIGGVHAGDLAEALIVGNAVDSQAVDIFETKAAIGQRLLESPQAEFIGIVLGELAITGVPDAHDCDAFQMGHRFPSLAPLATKDAGVADMIRVIEVPAHEGAGERTLFRNASLLGEKEEGNLRARRQPPHSPAPMDHLASHPPARADGERTM